MAITRRSTKSTALETSLSTTCSIGNPLATSDSLWLLLEAVWVDDMLEIIKLRKFINVVFSTKIQKQRLGIVGALDKDGFGNETCKSKQLFINVEFGDSLPQSRQTG